jgi:hypothetical protein
MPPTICLNMIVKNESEIIEETLTNLCNKIKFDYWVISDTGSTDNTPEIIENFFKLKNIPGELKHDEWKNFGYNRTLALSYAYNKTDLLLMFDADDGLVGDFILPPEVNYDKYFLTFGINTKFKRCSLINNRKRFKYVGVMHEYIECCEENSTSCNVEGNYYFIPRTTSSRNKDPEKYLKDATVLENAYEEEKKSGIINTRYSFYCANCYYDYGDFDNAIKWYKNTLEIDGWVQEKYISCYRLFKIYENKNMIEHALYYAVKSCQYDNQRVECIYELVKYYMSNEMPVIANNYYLLIKEYYENEYDEIKFANKLFLDTSIYDFYLPYYMIIVADRLKDTKTGINMFIKIFNKKYSHINQWYLNNIIYNLQFFINKIFDNKDLFNILFLNYIKYICNNTQLTFNKDLLTNYIDVNNVNFKINYTIKF